METVYMFAGRFITGVGLGVMAYGIPYLIRRGWIEGENATVKKKRVCDICFRDVSRWNEFQKKNRLETND